MFFVTSSTDGSAGNDMKMMFECSHKYQFHEISAKCMLEIFCFTFYIKFILNMDTTLAGNHHFLCHACYDK